MDILEIAHCKSFETIPLGLQDLKSIYSIVLTDLPIKNLPASLVGNTLAKLVVNNTQINKLGYGIDAENNLQYLDLSRNKIDSILPDISKLIALKELILTDNKLTSIPDELATLPALRKLIISSNQLKNINGSLSGLILLHELDISYNPILEAIDLCELNKLSNLRKLTIDCSHAPDFYTHKDYLNPKSRLSHIDFVNGDITAKQRNLLLTMFARVHSISFGKIFLGYTTYHGPELKRDPTGKLKIYITDGCGRGHWEKFRWHYLKDHPKPIFKYCVRGELIEEQEN